MEPFSGILTQPDAITVLRAAAGILVPNSRFADYNAARVTGSKSGFLGWNFTGAAPGHNIGNPGTAIPSGSFGASGLIMETTSTSSTVSINGSSSIVLGQTVYTDLVPFSRLFTSHYDHALTLAITAKSDSGLVPGTKFKAYIACFDSTGSWIAAGTHSPDGGTTTYTEANPVECTFTTTAALTCDWSQLLANTESVLPDNTSYIRLYIGISATTGTADIKIGAVSLMLNPTTPAPAKLENSGFHPPYFIEPGEFIASESAAMSWSNMATTDRVMMTGRRARTKTISDGLRHQFTATWSDVNALSYQNLMAIYSLSVAGLGPAIPEPVPLCIETGLGQSPWFGYYHVNGSMFNGTFHPRWTRAGGGYDITMNFIEV